MPSVVTTNEALVALFLERAVDLLRLEAGTRRKVFAILVELEKEIVAEIAKIDPTAPVRERYQRERLTRLLETVRSTIKTSYRKVNVLMTAEIREVVDLEGRWLRGAINTSVGIEAIDAGVTRTFLNTIASDVLIQGAPTKEWWGRQQAGMADKFADEMRRGMVIGESNAKLIQRVTNPDTGLMSISHRSAERLVRASVQTAANAARNATYDDNADLIKALRWHATLDTRTTPWCFVRDGKDYTPVDHKPIDHDIPWLDGPGALHWGCRSTSIPVLKTWRDLGIDADEVPETTRASMNGQVPAGTTFEDWFKKQPLERQNQIMGVGKAELWRKGKITFRDLLDQNGRPLTTEELRKRAA